MYLKQPKGNKLNTQRFYIFLKKVLTARTQYGNISTSDTPGSQKQPKGKTDMEEDKMKFIINNNLKKHNPPQVNPQNLENIIALVIVAEVTEVYSVFALSA